MKKNKLFQSLNDIDETIIEEAGDMKDFKKKKRFNPIEFLVPLVAVAIIMIIVLPTIFNRETPSETGNNRVERQNVIQEIKVFTTDGFDNPNSELLSVLNDEESLKLFDNIISTADKQEGIADVTSPDYFFDIYYANDSKERLYMWLQEDMMGSFMKAEDSNAIYNFSEETNRKLYDLIEKNRKKVPEKKDYNQLIKEPDYKDAQFRAELGTLFYETEERIGFSSSFGVFIYNIKTEELETAFRMDAKEGFGEEYFPGYMMTKDEENIEITAFSHQDVFSEYYYEYSLKDKNLYKVDAATKRKDTHPLPDEDLRMEAFYGSDWSLEGFIYNPIGSDKPLYPFKDLDLSDINLKIFKDLKIDEIDKILIVSNERVTSKIIASSKMLDVINYLKEVTVNEGPKDSGDNDRSNIMGIMTIYYKNSTTSNIYFKEGTLETDDNWFYGGIKDLKSFNDFYKSINVEEQPLLRD